MNVTIPFPVDKIEEGREPPSNTYRLDMDNRRILGKTDGLEAVNQAILKILLTPRFACPVYDNQYGSEHHELLRANDVTPEYLESELPELIGEALGADGRILDVNDFEFDFDEDHLYIRFTADTIFGAVAIEEEG